MLSLHTQGCIVFPLLLWLVTMASFCGCPCIRRVVSPCHAYVPPLNPLSLHTQGCIGKTSRQCGFGCVVPAYAGLYLHPQYILSRLTRCPCIRRVVSNLTPPRCQTATLSLHTQGCIAAARAAAVPPRVVPAYAGLYLSIGSERTKMFCCPCIRRVVSRPCPLRAVCAALSLHTQGCICSDTSG